MIPSTKIDHATKAQVYRWLNGYERYFTTSRIANQLELLTEDITITTPRESITGKSNFSNGLNDYKGMKIAHTIEQIAITTKPKGLILLNINLIYHGIQKDGTDNCLRFTYENELYQKSNKLPLFKSIKLNIGGAFESPAFKDSYPTLRSLALMYYYLFLIEKLAHNPAEFQEILTDDFQFNLSKNTVLNSIDGLGNWLQGVTQKLEVTSHYPKNATVKVLSRDNYELKVDFDWNGWTKTDQKMIGETSHTWIIIDKKNDRFAKIKSIDVVQLTPFSLIES